MDNTYASFTVDTSAGERRDVIKRFMDAATAIRKRDNPEPDDELPSFGGKAAIPHHLTYAGVYNWYQKYYYNYFDESLINSQENSLAMRRDGFIQELLRHRQLPTVALSHAIDCDDPDDTGQVKVKKQLARIIDNLSYFQSLKLQLSESLFYGKSGSQFIWGKKKISGKTYNTVIKHDPVHGDKIVYRFDGTPGVLVYAGATDFMKNSRYSKSITYVDKGPALFLDDQQLRDCFIIHEFERSDTDYLFESEKSLAVHGLGLRDRYYWMWNMRAELIGWMFNALQRVGANGMLYGFYQEGNDAAKRATLEALKNLIQENVAVFPVLGGNPTDFLQHIETNGIGYDVLYNLITHFEEIMRRGFLGQNLSSQSAATGLGSGVADLQAGTFENIILYDSSCLAETIDQQLVQKILKFNSWEYEGKTYRGDDLPFTLKFKLQVNRQNVKDMIQAAQVLYQMGVPLDAENLRDLAGLQAPKNKANALVMQMPQGPEGQPPGPGGPGGGEKPPGNPQNPRQPTESPEQPQLPRKTTENFSNDLETFNCGIGPGGFQRGNTCAKGDGGTATLDKPKFGKSTASMVQVNPVNLKEEDFRKSYNSIFNYNDDTVLNICGATDGSKVRASEFSNHRGKGFQFLVVGNEDSFESSRYVLKNKEGNNFIKNAYFEIKDPEMRGKGIGLEVFGRQVEEAIKQGFDYIETDAARVDSKDPADSMNGYYVWPRYGYDGEIPEENDLNRKAFDKFGAKRLSDLYRTKEGREWWKENGTEVTLRFDLTEGSLSRRIWESYLDERNKRETGRTPSPEMTKYSMGSGIQLERMTKSLEFFMRDNSDPGVMISFAVPPALASTLVIPGGEPAEELHVTLCYLGRLSAIGQEAADKTLKIVEILAQNSGPLSGSIGGMGRFSATETSDGQDVIYANVDLSSLPDFRAELVHILELAGVPYSRKHGYTPHITLKYIDPDSRNPVKRIPNQPVTFHSIRVSIGEDTYDFPFTSNPDSDTENFARNPCGDSKGGFEKGNTCAISAGDIKSQADARKYVNQLKKEAAKKAAQGGKEEPRKSPSVPEKKQAARKQETIKKQESVPDKNEVARKEEAARKEEQARRDKEEAAKREESARQEKEKAARREEQARKEQRDAQQKETEQKEAEKRRAEMRKKLDEQKEKWRKEAEKEVLERREAEKKEAERKEAEKKAAEKQTPKKGPEDEDHEEMMRKQLMANRFKHITRYAKEAEALGFKVIASGADTLTRLSGKEVPGTIAAFWPDQNTIIFNEKHDYYDNPQSKVDSLYSRGWFSSAAEDHVIVHEVAHGLHFKNVGEYRWRELRKNDVPSHLKPVISKQVSIYASSSQLEVVAEMYAGMKAGRQFSSELMNYYNSIGGPKVGRDPEPEKFERDPCGDSKGGFEKGNSCAVSKGDIKSQADARKYVKSLKNNPPGAEKGKPKSFRTKIKTISKPIGGEPTSSKLPVSESMSRRLKLIGELSEIAKKNGFKVSSDPTRLGQLFTGEKKSNIAVFSWLSDTISFNENHRYYDNPKEYMIESYYIGWLSTPTKNHIIVHEIAHGLHKKNIGLKRLTKLRKESIPKELESAIEFEVGKYALTNPMEFVAEVFTAMKQNEKEFSKPLMDLYRKFGGPDVSSYKE